MSSSKTRGSGKGGRANENVTSNNGRRSPRTTVFPSTRKLSTPSKLNAFETPSSSKTFQNSDEPPTLTPERTLPTRAKRSQALEKMFSYPSESVVQSTMPGSNTRQSVRDKTINVSSSKTAPIVQNKNVRKPSAEKTSKQIAQHVRKVDKLITPSKPKSVSTARKSARESENVSIIKESFQKNASAEVKSKCAPELPPLTPPTQNSIKSPYVQLTRSSSGKQKKKRSTSKISTNAKKELFNEYASLNLQPKLKLHRIDDVLLKKIGIKQDDKILPSISTDDVYEHYPLMKDTKVQQDSSFMALMKIAVAMKTKNSPEKSNEDDKKILSVSDVQMESKGSQIALTSHDDKSNKPGGSTQGGFGTPASNTSTHVKDTDTKESDNNIKESRKEKAVKNDDNNKSDEQNEKELTEKNSRKLSNQKGSEKTINPSKDENNIFTKIQLLKYNATSMESNATSMEESNMTSMMSNDTTIESNETSIKSNATSMESNKTSIESNMTNMESNTTSMKSNDTSIQSYATSMESNATNMESNDTSIESNAITMESNMTCMESNVICMESNVTSLESDETSMKSNDLNLHGDRPKANIQLDTINGFDDEQHSSPDEKHTSEKLKDECEVTCSEDIPIKETNASPKSLEKEFTDLKDGKHKMLHVQDTIMNTESTSKNLTKDSSIESKLNEVSSQYSSCQNITNVLKSNEQNPVDEQKLIKSKYLSNECMTEPSNRIDSIRKDSTKVDISILTETNNVSNQAPCTKYPGHQNNIQVEVKENELNPGVELKSVKSADDCKNETIVQKDFDKPERAPVAYTLSDLIAKVSERTDASQVVSLNESLNSMNSTPDSENESSEIDSDEASSNEDDTDDTSDEDVDGSDEIGHPTDRKNTPVEPEETESLEAQQQSTVECMDNLKNVPGSKNDNELNSKSLLETCAKPSLISESASMNKKIKETIKSLSEDSKDSFKLTCDEEMPQEFSNDTVDLVNDDKKAEEQDEKAHTTKHNEITNEVSECSGDENKEAEKMKGDDVDIDIKISEAKIENASDKKSGNTTSNEYLVKIKTDKSEPTKNQSIPHSYDKTSASSEDIIITELQPNMIDVIKTVCVEKKKDHLIGEMQTHSKTIGNYIEGLEGAPVYLNKYQSPHSQFEKPAKSGSVFMSSELDNYLESDGNRNVNTCLPLGDFDIVFKKPKIPEQYRARKDTENQNEESLIETLADKDEIDGLRFLSFESEDLILKYSDEKNKAKAKFDKIIEQSKKQRKFQFGISQNPSKYLRRVSNRRSKVTSALNSPLHSPSKLNADVDSDALFDKELFTSLHWKSKAGIAKKLSNEEMKRIGLKFVKRRKRNPKYTHRPSKKRVATFDAVGNRRRLGRPKKKPVLTEDLNQEVMVTKVLESPCNYITEQDAVSALITLKVPPLSEYHAKKPRSLTTGKNLERPYSAHFELPPEFPVKKPRNLTGKKLGRPFAKDRKKTISPCKKPGCRYGCICHLCEANTSKQPLKSHTEPLCDKEYCKLGCICASIGAAKPKHASTECRKPGCMFGCTCPETPQVPEVAIPSTTSTLPSKVNTRPLRRGKRWKKPNFNYGVGKEDFVWMDDNDDIDFDSLATYLTVQEKEIAKGIKKAEEESKLAEMGNSTIPASSSPPATSTEPGIVIDIDEPTDTIHFTERHMENSTQSPSLMDDNFKHNDTLDDESKIVKPFKVGRKIYPLVKRAHGKRDKTYTHLKKSMGSLIQAQAALFAKKAKINQSRSKVSSHVGKNIRKNVKSKISLPSHDKVINQVGSDGITRKYIHTIRTSNIDLDDSDVTLTNLNASCARTTVYVYAKKRHSCTCQNHSSFHACTSQNIMPPKIIPQIPKTDSDIEDVTPEGPTASPLIKKDITSSRSRRKTNLKPRVDISDTTTTGSTTLPVKESSQRQQRFEMKAASIGLNANDTEASVNASNSNVTSVKSVMSESTATSDSPEASKPVIISDLPSNSISTTKITVASPNVIDILALENSTTNTDLTNKFRCQMVLLQRCKMPSIYTDVANPKKNVDMNVPHLLEIHSNCNWEGNRHEILNFLSEAADRCHPYPKLNSTKVGKYIVEIMNKWHSPTPVPPHLKSRLPKELYAIRIKITLLDMTELAGLSSQAKVNLSKVGVAALRTQSKVDPSKVVVAALKTQSKIDPSKIWTKVNQCRVTSKFIVTSKFNQQSSPSNNTQFPKNHETESQRFGQIQGIKKAQTALEIIKQRRAYGNDASLILPKPTEIGKKRNIVLGDNDEPAKRKQVDKNNIGITSQQNTETLKMDDSNISKHGNIAKPDENNENGNDLECRDESISMCDWKLVSDDEQTFTNSSSRTKSTQKQEISMNANTAKIQFLDAKTVTIANSKVTHNLENKPQNGNNDDTDVKHDKEYNEPKIKFTIVGETITEIEPNSASPPLQNSVKHSQSVLDESSVDTESYSPKTTTIGGLKKLGQNLPNVATKSVQTRTKQNVTIGQKTWKPAWMPNKTALRSSNKSKTTLGQYVDVECKRPKSGVSYLYKGKVKVDIGTSTDTTLCWIPVKADGKMDSSRRVTPDLPRVFAPKPADLMASESMLDDDEDDDDDDDVENELLPYPVITEEEHEEAVPYIDKVIKQFKKLYELLKSQSEQKHTNTDSENLSLLLNRQSVYRSLATVISKTGNKADPLLKSPSNPQESKEKQLNDDKLSQYKTALQMVYLQREVMKVVPKFKEQFPVDFKNVFDFLTKTSVQENANILSTVESLPSIGKIHTNKGHTASVKKFVTQTFPDTAVSTPIHSDASLGSKRKDKITLRVISSEDDISNSKSSIQKPGVATTGGATTQAGVPQKLLLAAGKSLPLLSTGVSGSSIPCPTSASGPVQYLTLTPVTLNISNLQLKPAVPIQASTSNHCGGVNLGTQTQITSSNPMTKTINITPVSGNPAPITFTNPTKQYIIPFQPRNLSGPIQMLRPTTLKPFAGPLQLIAPVNPNQIPPSNPNQKVLTLNEPWQVPHTPINTPTTLSKPIPLVRLANQSPSSSSEAVKSLTSTSPSTPSQPIQMPSNMVNHKQLDSIETQNPTIHPQSPKSEEPNPIDQNPRDPNQLQKNIGLSVQPSNIKFTEPLQIPIVQLETRKHTGSPIDYPTTQRSTIPIQNPVTKASLPNKDTVLTYVANPLGKKLRPNSSGQCTESAILPAETIDEKPCYVIVPKDGIVSLPSGVRLKGKKPENLTLIDFKDRTYRQANKGNDVERDTNEDPNKDLNKQLEMLREKEKMLIQKLPSNWHRNLMKQYSSDTNVGQQSNFDETQASKRKNSDGAPSSKRLKSYTSAATDNVITLYDDKEPAGIILKSDQDKDAVATKIPVPIAPTPDNELCKDAIPNQEKWFNESEASQEKELGHKPLEGNFKLQGESHVENQAYEDVLCEKKLSQNETCMEIVPSQDELCVENEPCMDTEPCMENKSCVGKEVCQGKSCVEDKLHMQPGPSQDETLVEIEPSNDKSFLEDESCNENKTCVENEPSLDNQCMEIEPSHDEPCVEIEPSHDDSCIEIKSCVENEPSQDKPCMEIEPSHDNPHMNAETCEENENSQDKSCVKNEIARKIPSVEKTSSQNEPYIEVELHEDDANEAPQNESEGCEKIEPSKIIKPPLDNKPCEEIELSDDDEVIEDIDIETCDDSEPTVATLQREMDNHPDSLSPAQRCVLHHVKQAAFKNKRKSPIQYARLVKSQPVEIREEILRIERLAAPKPKGHHVPETMDGSNRHSETEKKRRDEMRQMFKRLCHLVIKNSPDHNHSKHYILSNAIGHIKKIEKQEQVLMLQKDSLITINRLLKKKANKLQIQIGEQHLH